MPSVDLTHEELSMLDTLVTRRVARARSPIMVAKWGNLRFKINRAKENHP